MAASWLHRRSSKIRAVSEVNIPDIHLKMMLRMEVPRILEDMRIIGRGPMESTIEDQHASECNSQ